MSGLVGRRVLIVEDEYFIADDLAQALRRAGAEIVGPVASRDLALPLIEAGEPDLAILDINLKGDMSFDVADALQALGVPFVFATGYDLTTVPSRYTERMLVQKPTNPAEIIAALEQEVSRQA